VIIVYEEKIMARDNNIHPASHNGQIRYLEIPSKDINESASFYNKVFGWKIRIRRDGSMAFDDAANLVSGTWKSGRNPHTGSDLMVYIMVDDVSATLETITANGGRVIEPKTGIFPEFIASFSDPSGNIFGIFQE
jgi:uncharacterized protein